MQKFGLIGHPLGHSFSQNFFTEKFKKEGIDAVYNLYDLEDINLFTELISKEAISGLNVTIPYKETIIPFLDKIDKTAEEVGAVNVIKIDKSNKQLIGYNSDCIGFEKSLMPLLKPYHTKALILGTGGASKAVNFVLNKHHIETKFVSRNTCNNYLTYESLNKEIIEQHSIIINTTPLGMFPKVDTFPEIPYNFLTPIHILYDLVYNPTESIFLKFGTQHGCTIKNGYEMLVEQALEAWRIWNK
ncbi:MAG: shikimate dehydrogenase [Paludibacteraceae bacterium]|nr:shikimate dehydrogenase [Paludibacteraceae bacterium]